MPLLGYTRRRRYDCLYVSTAIDVPKRFRRSRDVAACFGLTSGTSIDVQGRISIAKRCHKKPVVAMARKLAAKMHAMWRDGTFCADRPHADDASDAAPTAKDRTLLGAHS